MTHLTWIGIHVGIHVALALVTGSSLRWRALSRRRYHLIFAMHPVDNSWSMVAAAHRLNLTTPPLPSLDETGLCSGGLRRVFWQRYRQDSA